MRARQSTTIHQTLTSEAAAVLDRSMSEAARRGHGQTTPLHVAATLLACPSGHLRRACARSHTATSHPLQCRALELCFSVALDRLASGSATSPPPINNALMAALKRAQANQRRGCPEQLQQPLLAVKVELPQLVLSILDDPSVSRVMREAGFSSVAVKAAVDAGDGFRELGSKVPSTTTLATSLPVDRNLYMNPRFRQTQGERLNGQLELEEEVRRVMDVIKKKRNPILVGDSGLEPVLEELIRRIQQSQTGDLGLKNVKVLRLEKEMPMKIRELSNLIKDQCGEGGGSVVVDVGDLKYLVDAGDQDKQVLVTEASRAAVTEVGSLIQGRAGVWLIGTASCATYLRCQVYHPTMEGDWNLQAVPIKARPQPHPRGECNGILTSSIVSLASSRCSIDPSPNALHASRGSGESTKLVADKPRPALPPWLRDAASRNSQQPTTPTITAPTIQIKTDLVLGQQDGVRTLELLATGEEKGKLGGIAYVDSFKKLHKSLAEAVPWQQEVASAVALTVTQCRSGNGNRRPKTDTWLLFNGSDRAGKTTMAAKLSEVLFGASAVTVSLQSTELNSRGKTAMDRLAEALRRNPFSVFLLEDVDKADSVIHGRIRRAIEKGRLPDTHGREVSLGAAVFVMTATSLPESCRSSDMVGTKRPSPVCASGGGRRCNKVTKTSRLGLSLDLNLAVSVSEDDESDLTCEFEQEQRERLAVDRPARAALPEVLVDGVDLAVEFKPVDFGDVGRRTDQGIGRKTEATGGGARRRCGEAEEELLDVGHVR